MRVKFCEFWGRDGRNLEYMKSVRISGKNIGALRGLEQ